MRIVTSNRRPVAGALEIAPGVYRVDDDAAMIVAGATEVTGATARDAVPARTDLPVGHWLRGYRAVRTVWAGEPDQVMGEDGQVYPVGSAEELARLVKDEAVKKVVVAEPAELEAKAITAPVVIDNLRIYRNGSG